MSVAFRYCTGCAAAIVAAVVGYMAIDGLGGDGPAGAGRTPPASRPATGPWAEWRGPSPKSAGERIAERRRMVESQISRPWDARQRITDERTIIAMLAVPRHVFVPRDLADRAYDDTPLPIGHGQTISQPYIVALMTEALGVRPGDKVLEVGTGSGYQAAVLAHLTPHVYSVEIIEALARRAAATLEAEGYDTVKVRHADGYFGWKEHAPFDAIIVTCAAGHLPPPLWEQLRPGGRIVVPVGGVFEVQRLVVITKTEEGKRRSHTITDVRFVPMTGHIDRR